MQLYSYVYILYHEYSWRSKSSTPHYYISPSNYLICLFHLHITLTIPLEYIPMYPIIIPKYLIVQLITLMEKNHLLTKKLYITSSNHQTSLALSYTTLHDTLKYVSLICLIIPREFSSCPMI